MNYINSRTTLCACCVVLTLLASVTLSDGATCRAPFFGYGGSCYYFHNVSATLKGHTYSDSKVVCQNFGGRLASINTRNESHLVENLFKDLWVAKYQSYWIGLDDLANTGRFVWSDNTALTFQNWRNGSHGISGTGHCVRLATNATWVKSRCNLLFGFMCERAPNAVIPLKPTLPPYPRVSPAPRSCEVGWKPWGTSCYGVISGLKKTWADAQADCHRRFAELVVIDTSDEQAYLTNVVKPYDEGFWIGLTDKQQEGTFVWVDETTLSVTSWLKNEPNNAFGQEDCVAMRGGEDFAGGWNDNNCKASNNYICEKNSGTHNCPSGWITYGSYCYQLNAHPVQRFTWGAARNSCLAFNERFEKNLKMDVAEAHLVSILSDGEQKMLYEKLKNIGATVEELYYWVGLQEKKSRWTWTDRSVFKYHNWQSNTTELTKPLCVKNSLAAEHGGWVTANCEDKHIFVCKVKRGKDRCYDPIGMQNFRIPDVAITSNNQLTFSTPPIAARFYMKAGNTLDGAWCVARGAHSQRPYLQVDFGKPHKLTYIGVQGKSNSVSIVTQFMMMYSNDGVTWDPYWKYSVRFRISPMVYLSRYRNKEQTVHFRLKHPLAARYVRLYPYSCHVDCCMRVEFYGCEHEDNSLKCGRGWKEDPKTGHCYRLSEEVANWDDAQSYCINHGANLVSIGTAKENEFLKGELAPMSGKVNGYWTGLNDLEEKGLFRWEETVPTTYINWATDNPIKNAEQPYRIDYRDCYKECGNVGGLCVSFCGKNGYCCRRGWVDCPEDLSAAAGSSNNHVCVRSSGLVHKQCASIQTKDGKWMSQDCDSEREYICKRDYHATKSELMHQPFSTNWKTQATFYWPLDEIVKEMVQPFGIARGAFPVSSFTIPGSTIGRKVLPFDGHTNYLVLPLPGPCAVNPDASTCSRGFSFSILFRYDAADTADNRYIADTRNTGSLGYSVYLKLGHINVLLVGHKRTFTAFTRFERKVWNHFVFTYSPLKGLVLYMNGNQTVADTSGKANEQYITEDKDPSRLFETRRIVIAKSATKSVFTKIKLTSLALSEWPATPAVVRHVYLSELGYCSDGQLTHGSWCYELDTNFLRASGAREKCKEKGGTLITINSAIEQAFFTHTLRKYNVTEGVFIGLKSRNNEYPRWDDTTPVLYSYWGEYQPKYRRTYYYSVEYQVYAKMNGHWWLPTSSYKRMAYMCKIAKQIKGAGAQAKKSFNVVVRSSYVATTFGCPVTDQVVITSASYGRTSGEESCKLDPFLAKQKAESFCQGSTCKDVKLLKDVNPCKNTRHSPIFNITYECKTIPSALSQKGCPKGYVKYEDRICFRLHLRNLTIVEAIDQCKEDGAVIASISSIEEETFLASMMVDLYQKDDVWIGMRYDETTQKYSWMDRIPVTYTNWYDNYPDPRNGEFVKVSSSPHGTHRFMFWHPASKAEKHPFFCRKLKENAVEASPMTTQAPKGVCPKGWDRFRNSCYFVLKAGFGHIDASNECEKLGGTGADLVSIVDEPENAFVFNLLQNRTYFYNAWIGLTNEAILRGYHWRDGTPLKFINWYTDDPNTGTHHLCVGMNRAGKWWDLPCSSRYYSVCKAPVPAEPLTTRGPVLTMAPQTGEDKPPYCRMSLGDGVGGSETNERGLTPTECLARCLEKRKTNPRINGITVDNVGDKECYCEIGRTSWNTVDRYRSCQFEYSKPLPSKPIAINTAYNIVKGQLLTTISILRKEYSISFNLRPANYSATWASVLHITTGENSGTMGSRIPAVWLSKDGKLHVCTAINSDKNNCFESKENQHIGLNGYTNIRIEQAFIGNSYQFQVFINGQQVHGKTNYKAREYRDLVVYVGSPWYPAQAGTIKDLIINGTCCSRIEKGSEIFFHGNEVVLKKDQALTPPLRELKKEYAIRFEIRPISYPTAQMVSILYLSTGSSVTEFNLGSPWIYIKKDSDSEREARSLDRTTMAPSNLCMTINRKTFKCVKVHLPLHKWTTVQISQLKYSSDYIYQLSINGEVEFDYKNPNPKSYSDLNVYFSDPFHQPFNGSVRNIVIKDLLFCDPGWRTVNKSCYFFSKKKADFNEARRVCNNMTAYLATISDEYENKMLTETGNHMVGGGSEDYLYIGLTDRTEEGGWKWDDGSPTAYVNWAEGQPNDAIGGEDCVSLKRSGKWDDVPCNHKGYFVCEKSSDPDFAKKNMVVAPVDKNVGFCDEGWVRYGGKCYLFKLEFDDRSNFEDALTYCRSYKKGDLLSIHSAYENAFVLSQLKTPGHVIWMGLTDRRFEGSFMWTDQSSVDFTYWRGYEPNNQQNEDCTEMHSNFITQRGGWNDISCAAKMKFVCQKPPQKDAKPPKPSKSKFKCPAGYEKYKKNCYKMVMEPKTWSEALKECRKQEKGDLVSIHEMFVQAFLFSHSQGSATNWWIGLHKPAKTPGKPLRWSDKTPTTFQFWKSQQKPNLNTNSSLCISEVNDGKFDGLWQATNCSTKLPFVCQVSNTPLVRSPGFLGNCTKGWTKMGGKCYKYVDNDSEKWAEAQQKCRQFGGDLATVNSKQVQSLISNMVQFSVRKAWIGLSDRQQEHVWRWVSGQPYNERGGFTNWDHNEPNDVKGKENCVHMWTVNGYWNDAPCDNYYNYVCEHPIECNDPVGLESGKIPDAAITATSFRGTNFPHKARLNFKNNMSAADSWCANKTIDEHPELTIDLGDLTHVTRVQTQGLSSDYVISYYLDYSEDGVSWMQYMEENRRKRIPGNERYGRVNGEKVDLRAVYLKFIPIIYKNSPCLRVEVYGCQALCSRPLGMRSLAISTKQLSASSNSYPVGFARPSHPTGWCSGSEKPWFRIDLNHVMKITRVMATGKNMDTYIVRFGNSVATLLPYSGYEQNGYRIFPIEPSLHELEVPAIARIVEYSANDWINPVCLRVEVFGCEVDCDEPLGLESGEIEDSAISASSYLPSYPPSSARLHAAGGWCARTHNLFQYIQITLPESSKITHIATQGVGKSFVRSYNLQWSRSGYFYRQYDQDLDGNTNSKDMRKIKLKFPITAKYIRIVPITVQTRPCLRLEVYGCTLSSIFPTTSAAYSTGLSDGSKVGIFIFFLLLVIAVLVAGFIYYKRNGNGYAKGAIRRISEGKIRLKDDEVQIISNHEDDEMEDEYHDDDREGNTAEFNGTNVYNDTVIS